MIPLHMAASVGSTPLVEEIVKYGSYINYQESWGQTPLIIATGKSRLYTMAALLNLGADPDIKDYHHGYTALHVAVNTHDEENVLVLLDARVNLESIDAEGLTPMGLALRNKFYRVVPLFLEYGSKLSEGDRRILPRQLQDYVDKKAGKIKFVLHLNCLYLHSGVIMFNDVYTQLLEITFDATFTIVTMGIQIQYTRCRHSTVTMGIQIQIQ